MSKTYVRDKKGNEIFEENERKVKEYVDGKPVYQTIRTMDKVLDDNTQQIAKVFRQWLSEQD